VAQPRIRLLAVGFGGLDQAVKLSTGRRAFGRIAEQPVLPSDDERPDRALGGTHDSLLEAGQYIATLERRQGLKVACPEEICYRAGWIDAAQLERLAQPLAKNGYGQYLKNLLKEKVF